MPAAISLENLPERIILEDVTLRDGLQSEARSFSTDEKLTIVHHLIDAGVRRIQVGSFVHPRAVPRMADTEALFRKLLQNPDVSYSVLVLNREGLERAVATGVRSIYTAISASETHSRRNSRCSVSEAKEQIGRLIEQAKGKGVVVRAGVMMAFGCVYEGRIAPAGVLEIVRLYRKAGVDEIDLADTSGVANPKQVFALVNEAKNIAGDIPLSLHLHDARGMGLANMLSGILAGTTLFDTCAGGLGGCPFIPHAAGNIATEDAAYMLSKMGIETGVDYAGVCDLTTLLEKILCRPLPGKMASILSKMDETGHPAIG